MFIFHNVIINNFNNNNENMAIGNKVNLISNVYYQSKVGKYHACKAKLGTNQYVFRNSMLYSIYIRNFCL